MRQIYYLLLALMLLTSPALALEKVQMQDVTSWNVESPTGFSISGLDLDNLAPDSTTQIVFDNYGKILWM